MTVNAIWFYLDSPPRLITPSLTQAKAPPPCRTTAGTRMRATRTIAVAIKTITGLKDTKYIYIYVTNTQIKILLQLQ